MRERFKTMLSSNCNDIKLVEDMWANGYKLMTIVTPHSNSGIIGYVYWFEDTFPYDYNDGNPYEEI